MKRTLGRHRGFSARPLLALVLAAGAVAVISLPAAAGPKQPRSGKGGSSGTSTTTTTDSSGVQTFEGEKTPATPTELAVQPLTGGGFKVLWKDNATNETGYEVERLPAFAGGTALLGPDSIGFVDQQDQASVEYRVRARGVTLQSSWTSWAQGQSATSSFVILPPGSGFGGATAQPAAVGSPDMPGYDAKAIARWDVVPYQTFTGNFHIGVVAFHMNGIDRVEFSANGGPWKAVTEMQLNPLTNVWEYTAMLRAGDFADGPVEVRAVVYPKGAGEARVLQGSIDTGVSTGDHSMLLTASAHGSISSLSRFVSPTGDDASAGLDADSPKRTIAAAIWSIHQAHGNTDGATIYLLAGQHSVSSAAWPASQMANSQRWLTIEPAPEVSREAVHIRGATADNRFGGIKLLRWHNLSIDAVTGAEVVGSWVAGARVWYDGVTVDGVDRTLTTANAVFGNTSWKGGKYITDSIATNLQNATNGFALVRNTRVAGILSDAFSGSVAVINSMVTDINPGSSGAHPDILQFYGWEPRNVVLYGLRSDPTYAYPNGVQGFFVSGVPTFVDVAIVDCVFANSPSWSAVFAVDGAIAHMFVRNTTFAGPARWGSSALTSNVVFDGVTWTVSPPADRSGVIYR